jgi:hypothetical protein
MSALKIQQFGGMLPAWDDTLLPTNQGATAQNCYLFSGALTGWRLPKLLRTLVNPFATTAFRVPTLTRAQATATLTFSGQPNNNDWLKIGETTYTFRTMPSAAYDIKIMGTVATSITALLAAINIGISPNTDIANAGVSFWYGTESNPSVSLIAGDNTATATTLTVKAQDFGAAYNTIAVLESTSGARMSWSAATFTGGVNQTFNNDITSAATWLEFVDPDTNVVRSPVVDDKFNRMYWASPSQPPMYNDYARIASGAAPRLLGLNPPGCAPIVTITGGGANSTLGYSTSSSTNIVAPGANTLFLMPFTPIADDILQDIQVMPADTNPTALFTGVIYNDLNGAPGTLFATGSQVTGCVAGTAIVSTLLAAPTMTSGLKYWVGILTDTAVNIQLADDTNNVGTISYDLAYSNGPPAAIGGGKLPVMVVSATSTHVTIDTPLVQAIPINDNIGFAFPGSDWIANPNGLFFAPLSVRGNIGDTVLSVGFFSGSTLPTSAFEVRSLNVPAAIVGNPAPPPVTVPDLQMWMTVITGAVLEARAYVYTWVTSYGEESPPSPPTLVTGWDNATWTIGLFAPQPDDMGVLRDITHKRLYRTISAVGGQTDYFLVTPPVAPGTTLPPTAGDLDVNLATYVDTEVDTVIAGNAIMPSETWFPPPEGLQGIMAMPNGMLVGFKANELWFCEPYRPHAWPASYVVTTEFPIVGIGVTGSSVVACTSGTPYIFTGINPGSMSSVKLLIAEPCNSRGSVVSTLSGVFYCSPNGLILVSGSGVASNVTELWITRDKWRSLTAPRNIRAIALASCYFAFGTVQNGDNTYAQTGFTIELLNDAASFTIWPQPGGHRVGFNKMVAPNSVDIANVLHDPWSSIGILIQNGAMYYYDFSDAAPSVTPYIWRSKKYQQPSKKNFEAMKCFFTVPPGTPTQGVRNQAATNDASWNTLGPNQYGIIRVYADDVLVTTREIYNSGEMLRISSGFKAEIWQWEIESRLLIANLQVATSARELGGV